MSEADNITVRLRDVSKSFGETRALRSVDFEARAGEVHAIVGENGSGKSTLAKIMSGVLRPDHGEISILGVHPRNRFEARDAGLATIFQEVLVADEASIIDNLYVGRDALIGRRPARADRIREASALMERFVGAPIDLDSQVGSLPLSVKQWIVIARAILRRPKILILDESSAALDLDATTRLHGAIHELRAQGATILIVTHRIAELVRIADRATILRDGKAVGVLGRADITEENLLAMMTSTDRTGADTPSVVNQNRRAGSPPIMSAEGLRLSPWSPAFSFTLEPGQIVGVTGLDGQGHDDFARVLAGIRPPDAGRIEVRSDKRSEPLNDLGSAERLGVTYVSGDRKREGIFPDQSIFENLAIGIYSRNLAPLGVIRRGGLNEIFQREVDRLKVKIGHASHRITSLSGGNQQKVLIGRAFGRAPKVIVLNDPARGVDPGTKRDLYQELRRFAIQGGAVLYLSSEIEEFIGFADRVDVFVGQTIFRSLSGEAIQEDEMLAAMFAQNKKEKLIFESQGTV